MSPPTVAVFTSGTEGYHTFRIPALLVVGDGHLLAFAEARREGAADSGEIDLVQRRSEDGGRTWGSLELVRHWAGHTCGNPAPVRTIGSGLVLLSLTNGAEATEDPALFGDAVTGVFVAVVAVAVALLVAGLWMPREQHAEASTDR